MIYLLISGHKQEYSLFNLIKVFFPNNKIKVIEDFNEYKTRGILVESNLDNYLEELYSITNLYLDGKICSSNLEAVNDVKIDFESLEKKTSIAIRKSLYKLLERSSELDSPWGILTGVRPMKIIHELINENLSSEQIRLVLKDEYLLNKEKIDMMINIAKVQRDYIYPLEDKYSLYISIPFCPSRCYYCSFPSLSIDNHKNQIEKYIEKLIYEIDSVSKIMKDKKINTVYIGGGTPTSIKKEYLEEIIQKIHATFGIENIKEFTVEAGRPDTIDKSYLEMLKRNGIKRISINPQTMNDITLIKVGRKHTVDNIIETYKMAKDIGFECINMDLILGLPGEDEIELINTMDEIAKLNPDNLTIHTLSLKTGSNLMKDEIDHTIYEQNKLRNMLDITIKYANNLDLVPYYLYRQKRILGNLENIGFAKKSKECIYNIVMMEEKQTIIGVGMGAVSKIYDKKKDKIIRMPNFKSLKEYINRIDELNDRKQKAIENLK